MAGHSPAKSGEKEEERGDKDHGEVDLTVDESLEFAKHLIKLINFHHLRVLQLSPRVKSRL